MSQVEKDDEHKKNRPLILTQDHLQSVWDEFINLHVRQNTVKSSFKKAVLSIEGKQINVVVPSQVAKGNIIAEGNLMDYLREKLGSDRIMMKIIIDVALKQPVAKRKITKLLTEKDKYLLMREQNPELDELRKRLDLGLSSQ